MSGDAEGFLLSLFMTSSKSGGISTWWCVYSARALFMALRGWNDLRLVQSWRGSRWVCLFHHKMKSFWGFWFNSAWRFWVILSVKACNAPRPMAFSSMFAYKSTHHNYQSTQYKLTDTTCTRLHKKKKKNQITNYDRYIQIKSLDRHLLSRYWYCIRRVTMATSAGWVLVLYSQGWITSINLHD